jgi:ferric-dicitrate binding protein FerR (iron transport regulator)
MSRRSFPRIDPAALRDHADEARVERVWDRVEHDLTSRLAGALPAGPHGRRWRSSLGLVALAATLSAFGAGLLLGKATWGQRTAEAPIVTPIIEKSLIEVLAAGTELRAFPLQGGGTLTLSPGATVEVERAGTTVTLSLLQGAASIQSTGGPLAIVAGEARINTRAGSVLSVTRNAEDLDVSVTDGSVSVSSPAGSRQLGRNERAEAVPLHAAVSIARADAKPSLNRASRTRGSALGSRQMVAKASNVPEWFNHYPGDYALALSLLHRQDVGVAIETAHDAAELMAIAELMSGKSEEIHALERLVRAFPSDQRSSPAAERLARIYEARGETLRAKGYHDQVQILAQNATTGSDSLSCDLIRRETDKTKAALSAKEYLAKYPDGECREEFERLVQGNAPAPAPAPSVDPAPAPQP